MKAAYVRPGGPLFLGQAGQDKAVRLGVTEFFYDANDPRTWDDSGTTRTIKDELRLMREKGNRIGLNRNTKNDKWPDSETDPVMFGLQLSADITRLDGDGAQLEVLADVELHDAAWVLRMMRAFRSKRPGRYLYWTMEPLQFAPSWITDELVGYLKTAPYTWVVPQLYRGDMSPVSERACVDEIMARGLTASKVHCYYGAMCERFDGILFDFANIAG